MLRQEIINQIAALQNKLAVLNSVPEDLFNFGTVVVFASPGHKWWRVKTEEETWKDFSTNEEKSLSEWVLEAKQSNIGYFEVYELKVQPAPFYASA